MYYTNTKIDLRTCREANRLFMSFQDPHSQNKVNQHPVHVRPRSHESGYFWNRTVSYKWIGLPSTRNQWIRSLKPHLFWNHSLECFSVHTNPEKNVRFQKSTDSCGHGMRMTFICNTTKRYFYFKDIAFTLHYPGGRAWSNSDMVHSKH